MSLLENTQGFFLFDLMPMKGMMNLIGNKIKKCLPTS